MKRRRTGLWLAGGILAGLHLVVLLAGLVAPNDPAEQHREHAFAPPTRVRLVDAEGKWRRPFVYRMVEREMGRFEEDRSQAYPVRFLVAGWEYRIAGVAPSRIHLFGVDEPARIFLFGTDGYGRDQLARWLFGGQISLLAGLFAAALALGLGTAMGLLAGFYGRWVDALLSRAGELFLALPWLYLLFAVRGFLPLNMPPAQALVLVVGVVGLVGWARPARLVRGIALSARESPYVLAARGFGASDIYLMRRHLLPRMRGLLLTQATILIPQFVLAEVALSFVGLGVGEPTPSWGNMLASLQQYQVMASYPWMFLPVILLIVFFHSYFGFSQAFQKQLKSTAS